MNYDEREITIPGFHGTIIRRFDHIYMRVDSLQAWFTECGLSALDQDLWEVSQYMHGMAGAIENENMAYFVAIPRPKSLIRRVLGI